MGTLLLYLAIGIAALAIGAWIVGRFFGFGVLRSYDDWRKRNGKAK
jgi:uncharacterized membrane protein